ncbi:hypothetical protein [Carboxylicivirga sp. M1479]|uniref:hypothetical protein n=1 Tax=Carboxylicivirga sp. M1479 TaxID=2594476 RepID=UPI00163DB9FA|nr:hypothetical protein [Carboxylicivirga sp. M1479]
MKNFEKLPLTQLTKFKGGKRHVNKYDLNGDGKWDTKTVYNDRTGKFKQKIRVN